MSDQTLKLDQSLDKTFDEIEGLSLLSPHAIRSPVPPAAPKGTQVSKKDKSDSYEATLSQISYLMQKLQHDGSTGKGLPPHETTEQRAEHRSNVRNVKARQQFGISTSASSAQSWVSSIPNVANKTQPPNSKKNGELKSHGTVEERLLAYGKQTSRKKIEMHKQQVAKLDEEFLDVKMSKVPITKLAQCSSEHVTGVPISDRLYQYGLRAKDRKARLSMARIADEEAKMKSPIINPASQKCTRTVEDLLVWDQRKNQRHTQMRLSKESSFSISQNPTVCKGTLKIVEKMKERFAVPLEQRLMTSDKQSKIEELKKELSRQEMVAIESTKVQMSETSKQIIAQKHDREKVAIGIRLSQNRRHCCFYEAAEKVDFTHAAPKNIEKIGHRSTSAPRERSAIPIEDRLLAMGELYEEKKKQEIAENNLRCTVSVPKVMVERENSQGCVWNRLFQEKILMNKGQRISCQPESPKNYFDKLDDIENCTFRPAITAVSQELDRRYSGGKTGVSRLEWMYEWATQKDQKHELLRSLKQNESAIANSSSSNRKFNEAEFFERMKQFEESRSKSNVARRIHHEQEELKECTFTPSMPFSQEDKRLHVQRPTSALQNKRSSSPSYAALHTGRCRSTASSRTTTPLKNTAPSSASSKAFERVSHLLDTSVASATSDKRAAYTKISMDLLFTNTN